MVIKNSTPFTILINVYTAIICMLDLILWSILQNISEMSGLTFIMGIILFGVTLMSLNLTKRLTEGCQYMAVFILSFFVVLVCTSSLGFGLLVSILNFVLLQAFFQVLYWKNLKFYPCRDSKGICVYPHNEVSSNH